MKIFKDKKNVIILAIIAIIIVLIVVLVVLFRGSIAKKSVGVGELVPRNYEQVTNEEELSKKLDIDITGINDEKSKTYIEDENIGRIEYDLNGMNMTLKITKDVDKDLVNMYHEWNTDILMTATCTDGTKINVMANVAYDDPTVMRARWSDNNMNYSMTTQNLSTREDFLQEINRLVIQNHK